MQIKPNEPQFKCDWRLALNAQAVKKAPIGYLLSWSGCGGLSLCADIEVWHPLGSTSQVVPGPKIQCVGVIESMTYGGDNDPIELAGYVSRENAANVRAKLAQPLTNTKLSCSWYVLDFDEDRKTWYEAAYVRDGSDAEGNIDARDGEQQLFVQRDSEAISPSIDIGVFRLNFIMVPASGRTTELQFATGPTIKLVRSWGSSDD